MEDSDIFTLIDGRAVDNIANLLQDPDTKDTVLGMQKLGSTPIHYAIRIVALEPENDRVLQILRLLLNAAANTDHINATDGDGNTPLDLVLCQDAFNLALYILIIGGHARPAVLTEFVKHPPFWADFRQIAFVSLLSHNRDCAIFVAHLLQGDADFIGQIGSNHPEIVNRLTNRAWFIFIDWALRNGCDKAVVQLLPMVHRIPVSGLFFRAFRHRASETMEAILQTLSWVDRIDMVLVVVRMLMKNRDYQAALDLLNLNNDLLEGADFTPPEGFLSENPDRNQSPFDFIVPINAALYKEDNKDQDLYANHQTDELLSFVILTACRSDQPLLLDQVINCLGVDDNALAAAFDICLPKMAFEGTHRFIELACQRRNVSQRAKTIALATSIEHSQIGTASVLLSCGASPYCYTEEDHWLPLDPHQQGGQLQHSVIYTLLQLKDSGSWHTAARNCTFLLLAYGGRIEFWNIEFPRPGVKRTLPRRNCRSYRCHPAGGCSGRQSGRAIGDGLQQSTTAPYAGQRCGRPGGPGLCA